MIPPEHIVVEGQQAVQAWHRKQVIERIQAKRSQAFIQSARSSDGRAAGFQPRSVAGSTPVAPSISFRLFCWLWRNYFELGDEVVKVTGWRSCLLDTRAGDRRRVTFMPLATFFAKRRKTMN